MSNFSVTLQQIDEILNSVNKIQTFSNRNKWILQINKHLRKCNLALKSFKFSTGVKHKIHTKIAHLKRMRCLLKVTHVGEGLEKSSKRVKWENINAAFESRLKTGVIINLSHKDMNAFFTDAFKIFKNKILLVLKKTQISKVNTTFCGDFIKQSKDVELVDRKYFSTPNVVLDIGDDLHDWFRINIIDPILNSLSEFAEKESGWALSRIIFWKLQ